MEETMFKAGSANIKVIGVGGGGGNALNRMIEAMLSSKRYKINKIANNWKLLFDKLYFIGK